MRAEWAGGGGRWGRRRSAQAPPPGRRAPANINSSPKNHYAWQGGITPSPNFTGAHSHTDPREREPGWGVAGVPPRSSSRIRLQCCGAGGGPCGVFRGCCRVFRRWREAVGGRGVGNGGVAVRSVRAGS